MSFVCRTLCVGNNMQWPFTLIFGPLPGVNFYLFIYSFHFFILFFGSIGPAQHSEQAAKLTKSSRPHVLLPDADYMDSQ